MTRGMDTGYKDINGDSILVGDTVSLLVDGEVRVFQVEYKTVVREVVSHPNFIPATSKVSITGIVFCWNGYDLFPCVDKEGIIDTEKMTIQMPREVSRTGTQESVSKIKGTVITKKRTTLVKIYDQEPTMFDNEGNPLYKMHNKHITEDREYCSECGKRMTGNFLYYCDNCGASLKEVST